MTGTGSASRFLGWVRGRIARVRDPIISSGDSHNSIMTA